MNKIKHVFFGVIILLLLSFVYFVTYTFAEPKAYDFMTKNVVVQKMPFDNHKNIYGHDDIVLIVVDSKTNEKYRWPWKRKEFCKIFGYLSEYSKTKAVIFDFLIRGEDKNFPDSDKQFFNSVAKLDNFIAVYLLGVDYWEDSAAEQKYYEKFLNKYSYKINRNFDIETSYNSIIPFPEGYFNSLKNTGFANLLPGFLDRRGSKFNYTSDQIIRTHMPLLGFGDLTLQSLCFKAYLLMNNNPEVIVSKNYITVPKQNLKIRQTTTDCLMLVPLKFYKIIEGTSYSHKYYSAADVMDSYESIRSGKKPKINPEVFKDKIVLIGGNVPAGAGLNDNKNSPITVMHPGVDIQATAIDNIIHNDFLTVLPKWLNLLIAILGMFCIFNIIKYHKLIKALSYIIIGIFLYLVLCMACFYCSVVINVITPVVMFVLTMIIGYVHSYLTESRNKEKVKSAMGKYMSEDVMKDVLKNIDNLGLGGKKAIVTVLFSDIRGFTSLSENMEASQVSELLNEYFSEMEPIVTKYNGIINKFIGDAVMAVFGEPIQDENHPSNAVRCGFEMLKRVEELDKEWASEGKPAIKIGVGVNTGEVFVGNIGSEKRMEYTVIGDTVNLASRLESYNKTYKTKMLISSSTYERSKEIAEVNKISDVEIRGKAEKMDIYEVKNVL